MNEEKNTEIEKEECTEVTVEEKTETADTLDVPETNDEETDIIEEAQKKRLDPPTEEEFTRAMETMSAQDRTIFENTSIIHVDRDMPAITQAMHVVDLQKKHEQTRHKYFKMIMILMVIGIITASIGIYVKSQMNTAAPVAAEETPGVKEGTSLKIDETAFKDAAFRSYVSSQFDKDSDGSLSADEINAVIMISFPDDTYVTDLSGIEIFPMLQSLTAKNQGITELDVSENTQLTFIDITNDPITSLDLSANEAMQHINAAGTSLTELKLPLKTVVTELDTEGTSLKCTKNGSGYYYTCE